MKALPKVKSLGELRRLATTEGPLSKRYERLAILAASNLGGTPKGLEGAMRHLKAEADASDDDDGVVNEVNFVRDIEAKENRDA